MMVGHKREKAELQNWLLDNEVMTKLRMMESLLWLMGSKEDNNDLR